MKQKAILLKTFVKNFPREKAYSRSGGTIPSNFYSLSYKDKYYAFKKRLCDRKSILKASDEVIFCGVSERNIYRYGNRFYTKSKLIEYIYISKNEINIKTATPELIREFLLISGIDWFKDIPNHIIHVFFKKPCIFKAVITKRIYSEETLYKAIASRIYKIKEIGWKTLRNYLCTYSSDYCYGYDSFSLVDICHFTKNPEESVKIITLKHGSSDLSLYHDLLSYAVQLNQIVDFQWSISRIREEHNKQIEICNFEKIQSKKTIPIYSNPIITKEIKQLNTEADIFKEGLEMHHCLYNCYYNRIEKHKYIAFHMYTPEDCTFSVKCDAGNHLLFDQIYLKYDKPVKPETKLVAEAFIAKYYPRLINMFQEPIQQDYLFVETNTIDGLDLPY